jgi:hypothetical protein
VHAPTDIVWERILDFDHYADMVPKTVESSNYYPQEELQGPNNDTKKVIYTQMKVGFPLLKLQFFIRHEYHPALNSLTWTLDYSKTSDLDDSCGYWYVIPHPEKGKDWSRVYYSVDVSMFDWVPSFVVNFMSRQALTEATGWVKKFSEQEYMDKQQSKEEEEATPEKQQPQQQQETPRKQEPKQKPTRRQQRRPRWWFGGKPPLPSSTEGAYIKDDKDDDDTVATTDTCDDESESSLEGSKTTETTATPVDTNKATAVAPIVSLTRYVLVASVLGLGMYNVHLYFSQ